LIASLPASEIKAFREEFETVGQFLFMTPYQAHTIPQEYEDVQLTAFLSTLTKSANILNDVGHLFSVSLPYTDVLPAG
jgi:COP9 signalosome complex subunit 6